MNVNPVRFAFLRWMLLALIAGFGVSGCTHFGKKTGATPAPAATPAPETAKPPKYVKITGRGNANVGKTATVTSLTFAGILSGSIKSDASATFDKTIADPAQRALMAQAEARRKALRALGQTILTQRDIQGQALGEALKKSPTDQSKLNTLLEQKARVTFQTEGPGVRATATIEGQQVMETLGLVSPVLGATTPAELDEKKAISASLALEAARKNLRQALLETALPDGRTVKQALAQDQTAAVDFDALIFIAQPDETLYYPDGSCVITIFFDVNRLPEIFKPPHHWWKFW